VGINLLVVLFVLLRGWMAPAQNAAAAGQPRNNTNNNTRRLMPNKMQRAIAHIGNRCLGRATPDSTKPGMVWR
jgi:hypothetical protein